MLVAAAMLVASMAAFSAPAFADKGGIPHEGSNGQGQAAAQTQVQGKALAKVLPKQFPKHTQI